MRLAVILTIVTCVAHFAETPTCWCSSPDTTEKLYGEASWYGFEEAGDFTACCEKFNPKELTAAHPSLPFGTLVKVTRLDCGKNVVVRINDRGPFKWRRIIDVSPAAATELDMFEIGITRVCVEILDDAPPPDTTPVALSENTLTN